MRVLAGCWLLVLLVVLLAAAKRANRVAVSGRGAPEKETRGEEPS